jgi:hypothetical protein
LQNLPPNVWDFLLASGTVSYGTKNYATAPGKDIFHKNREISILTMKKKQQG